MSIHLDNYSFRNNRDDCRDSNGDGCRAVVNKRFGVSTPVAVDISTDTGNIKVTCCEPSISDRPVHNSRSRSRSDCNSSRCEFTINQLIKVEIPICYHVQTDVDDSIVNCDVDDDDDC